MVVVGDSCNGGHELRFGARADGFAHAPATIRLGDLEVQRMVMAPCVCRAKTSGASRNDPARAIQVLRRAVDLGVNLIDTAWYYGPLVANRLIADWEARRIALSADEMAAIAEQG